MNAFYKLGLFFSLAILLAGAKCSSFKSSKSGLLTGESTFADDTVKINEFLGLARANLYHDAKKTILNVNEALKLAQKHSWGKGKIQAYNILSSFYLMEGSYDLLRELSNETMLISSQLDMPLYTAHAIRFMGESYAEYRLWDSAQVNYENALFRFVQMGDDSSRALCLENMANLSRERDDMDEAKEYYQKAYDLFDKINYENGKAIVLQSWGYMYVKCADYKNAEINYMKALAIYKAQNNFYGELSIYNDLGNSYFWEKRYDESIEESNKALAYARKYNSIRQSNWAHQTLGRSYKAKKMFTQSILHSERAYWYRRTMHEEYVQRQYTMTELVYENRQKDLALKQQTIDEQNQIQRILIAVSCLIILGAGVLYSNNRKLRRKNAEIQEAMIQGQTIERKRVAAELHDHLGGTLASLNWYLFGIDQKALPPEEQKMYKRVQEMVGAAYKEVRSLSHNLIPDELEESGLIVALDRLIGKLNENKTIHFIFNHNNEGKRYGTKTEFELYSIVRELTHNITKHSKATVANISLVENQKTIALKVTDNGIGIDENSKDGIGLNNIKSRVNSLLGNITISKNADTGVSVYIEIPNVTR